MRLPALNNRVAIKAYLAGFERRFVQTREGVIYLPGEHGAGVKLTEEEAAARIAAMRATLFEADGQTPLWGADSVVAAIFASLMAILFATILGYPALGFALVLPIVLAVIAFGPVLGAIRVELAWRRGLARTDEALADHPALPVDETRALVPPNPVRPVLIVGGVLVGAFLIGLAVAALGTPPIARYDFDNFLSAIALPVATVVISVALISSALDAARRRRVSEARISEALGERKRRPLI